MINAMNTRHSLATDGGLLSVDFENGRFGVVDRRLEAVSITAVAAAGGALLAGAEDGIWRSTDGGVTWSAANEGLAILHIRWLLAHPDRPGGVFAGTEPAGIFVSTDDGQTWTGRPEVENLRDELGWWLPYSPEAGCVRGFAFHGARGYAAVEVGGVLRTDDGGSTWRLAPGSSGDPQFDEPQTGFIHADVHSVEVHPTSPDLVFAATNAGLYRSVNGGVQWERINADGYTRAAWPDPDDPDHIISGPAAGVGSGGRVLETQDGGASWEPLHTGLDAPWRRTMVERFYTPAPGFLLAILDDGRMRLLDRQAGAWRAVDEIEDAVRAIAS